MHFRKRLLVAAGAAALVAAWQLPAFAEGGVTQEQLDNSAKTSDSVLMNGLGPKDQRFSSIKTITKDNIKGLIPAWSFSFGGEKQPARRARHSSRTA